jgi:hypothetical protein
MVLEAAPGSPVPHIGLLAPGVTDTISADAQSVKPFDLDGYLPMLYNLIPPAPAESLLNP